MDETQPWRYLLLHFTKKNGLKYHLIFSLANHDEQLPSTHDANGYSYLHKTFDQLGSSVFISAQL